jgi:hypothetical protein
MYMGRDRRPSALRSWVSESSAQNSIVLWVSSDSGIIIYIKSGQEEICAFFQAEMRPLLYQHVIVSGRAIMMVSLEADGMS